MDYAREKNTASDAERQRRNRELTSRINIRVALRNLELEADIARSNYSRSLTGAWGTLLTKAICDHQRVEPAARQYFQQLRSTNQALVDRLKAHHPDAFLLEGRPHTYGVEEGTPDLVAELLTEVNQRYAAVLNAKRELDACLKKLSDNYLEIRQVIWDKTRRRTHEKEQELREFKAKHNLLKFAGLTFGATGETNVTVRIESRKRTSEATPAPATPAKRAAPTRDEAVGVPTNRDANTVEELLAD